MGNRDSPRTISRIWEKKNKMFWLSTWTCGFQEKNLLDVVRWGQRGKKEPSAVPGYRCEGFLLKNLVVTQDQWNSLGSTETRRKFAFIWSLLSFCIWKVFEHEENGKEPVVEVANAKKEIHEWWWLPTRIPTSTACLY